MEVLQKITLYDLLGYTVPGTIFIMVLGICLYDGNVDMKKYTDYAGYICAGVILLGYALGMVISEVTDIMYRIIRKLFSVSRKDEIELLGYSNVAHALKNAGAVEAENTIGSVEDVRTYYDFMYAAVQSDPQYSRIHNYASSQLVCKNMAFVVFLSSILLRQFRPDIMGNGGVVLGIIMTLLFVKRYNKQRNKKADYAVAWFVQKYSAGK